jgi:hypothetical protein
MAEQLISCGKKADQKCGLPTSAVFKKTVLSQQSPNGRKIESFKKELVIFRKQTRQKGISVLYDLSFPDTILDHGRHAVTLPRHVLGVDLMKSVSVVICQGCQMIYLQTKNSNFGKCWRV